MKSIVTDFNNSYEFSSNFNKNEEELIDLVQDHDLDHDAQINEKCKGVKMSEIMCSVLFSM